ncbi:MAG: endonuclease Q family protein [Nanoarchaeota archaeon]|nr:endonuclease Q family protein [Nanoarchaeota archaeon]
MRVITDLHVHSEHSQATGKDLNLANLEKWARVKGVNLLGTGDFTHPKWISEIKQELTDKGEGILYSKSGFPFLLQTEISLVYTQGGKGRRIHHLVYAPDIDAVKKITDWLLTRGRVDYDGRPIFGIPSPEFVERLKAIDERIEIIPAHAWTPWFGALGENGGFNSIKECFQDMEKHIFAIETGLSSDPCMNWRISALDKYTLVSNSDLHSFWPWRMGREANVFELKDLTYKNIINTIKTQTGFVETLEVDPAFGKYHWTGHRACNVSLSPTESKKLNDICPVCKKKLTVGVEQRVEELADRPEGYMKKDAIPFKRIIPLSELLAQATGKAVSTKGVWERYHKLVTKERTELDILLTTPQEELVKASDERIASILMANREGKIQVVPGYDGEYGIPQIPGEAPAVRKPSIRPTSDVKQRSLSGFL